MAAQLDCHYILMLWFLLSFFPRLFSTVNGQRSRLDVYHTSKHNVALVQIQNASLKCAARGSLQIQDAKIRNLRTIAELCQATFATKACIDNQKKKRVKQQFISSACPHNMVNFGPLTAEIGRQVWGTPANVNGFRVLA